MTDKEMLLHLFSKLKFKETEKHNVHTNEFKIDNVINVVTIFVNKGYVDFYFDKQDNLVQMRE